MNAVEAIRAAATGALVALVFVLTPPGLGPEATGGSLETGRLEALDLRPYPPGTPPPAFSGRTLDGRTVSLLALRGQVVLLNFWATWCLECRDEMRAFERLHREFGSEGLTVLGINVREEPGAIRRYAASLDLRFLLVLDPSGNISAQYGVIGLPTTFLIGRNGQAVALAIGPREWGGSLARALIRALLGESRERRGE